MVPNFDQESNMRTWESREQQYVDEYPLWNFIANRNNGPDYPDCSSEAFEGLRQYVEKKLLESGVIPEHHTNPDDPDSVAARIVHNAWNQPDRYHWADIYIRDAIMFPPSAIDKHHFSLKAFIAELHP